MGLYYVVADVRVSQGAIVLHLQLDFAHSNLDVYQPRALRHDLRVGIVVQIVIQQTKMHVSLPEGCICSCVCTLDAPQKVRHVTLVLAQQPRALRHDLRERRRIVS
jgi:hypothetical protein